MHHTVSGIDFGNVLNDVAKVAASASPVVQQVLAATSSGADVVPVPVVVNPVWSTLATVLGEVAWTIRATTPTLSPDQTQFLSVIDRLTAIATALQTNPSDPALLAEYKALSDFLAGHPDSPHLAEYIATHPALQPVLAAAAATNTVGRGGGGGGYGGHHGGHHAAHAAARYQQMMQQMQMQQQGVGPDGGDDASAGWAGYCPYCGYATGFNIGDAFKGAAHMAEDLAMAPVKAAADLAMAPVNAIADLAHGGGGGPAIQQLGPHAPYARPRAEWQREHAPHGYEMIHGRPVPLAGVRHDYAPPPPRYGAGQYAPPPPPQRRHAAPRGRPAPPASLNSFARWRQIHPDQGLADAKSNYAAWWSAYGQGGATIN